MFYIIEKLRGTPKIGTEAKALNFGRDDVYDYYVIGCETFPEQDKYGYEKIKEWNSSRREHNVEAFIKQVQKIMKRENFKLLLRVY